MAVLIAYASKHGATQHIAERIADTLRRLGLEVETEPIRSVKDVARYQAFIIGGALYFGSWLKDFTAFVKRNDATLASRPVWLFSSGPLGTEARDAKGQDLRELAVPKQLAAIREAIKPRDHRVFFGALDHTSFSLGERLLWALPAGRELLIEGDFRDWSEIEAWAEGIAQELAPISAN